MVLEIQFLCVNYVLFARICKKNLAKQVKTSKISSRVGSGVQGERSI